MSKPRIHKSSDGGWRVQYPPFGFAADPTISRRYSSHEQAIRSVYRVASTSASPVSHERRPQFRWERDEYTC